MDDYWVLLLGVIFAGGGGELFVRGTVWLAYWARISPEIMYSLGLDAFVIGATVVALGTSAPELATIIIAKLRHHDDIACRVVAVTLVHPIVCALVRIREFSGIL